MIQDRGKKKWTAFMMLEHVKFLRNFADDDRKQKKPLLDEQELEDINIIIFDSLNYCLPIKIETWKSGYFNKYEGIVDNIDFLNKDISLLSDDGEIIKITINTISKTERL